MYVAQKEHPRARGGVRRSASPGRCSSRPEYNKDQPTAGGGAGHTRGDNSLDMNYSCIGYQCQGESTSPFLAFSVLKCQQPWASLDVYPSYVIPLSLSPQQHTTKKHNSPSWLSNNDPAIRHLKLLFRRLSAASLENEGFHV